jgi:hypothetical protein
VAPPKPVPSSPSKRQRTTRTVHTAHTWECGQCSASLPSLDAALDHQYAPILPRSNSTYRRQPRERTAQVRNAVLAWSSRRV